MNQKVYFQDFIKGLFKENPVFRLMLGMCPTLAVTSAAMYGFSMGLATSFVLICSSLIISLFKNFIPAEVRIPSFIVIIATFVTIVDLFLKAFLPAISVALGPYVPLIVVNCLILGRQEAFASKHAVDRSLVDALGMGLGFTLSLTFLGGLREIFGMGTLFNVTVLGAWFRPWVIMILPPGAFLTLGIVLGLINHFSRSKE